MLPKKAQLKENKIKSKQAHLIEFSKNNNEWKYHQ